jgi:hypothetical protein
MPGESDWSSVMTNHDHFANIINTIYSYTFSYIRCPSQSNHVMKIIIFHNFYFGFDRFEKMDHLDKSFAIWELLLRSRSH